MGELDCLVNKIRKILARSMEKLKQNLYIKQELQMD